MKSFCLNILLVLHEHWAYSVGDVVDPSIRNACDKFIKGNDGSIFRPLIISNISGLQDAYPNEISSHSWAGN